MEQEQVNMMAYLLGGLGEGMSPEGSFGKAAGGMAKGWAQSSQYMNLLKRMLGGMPAGSKMSGDRDNLNFKIPTQSLNFGGELDLKKPSVLDDTAKPGLGGDGGQGMLNPFSSSLPEVSSAALAGLTTEDISQALQFKFMKEELGQKKMSDVADIMYKGGMLSVAERGAATAERKASTEEFIEATELAKSLRSHPFEVPGVGKVDYDTWKTLDLDDRKYASYVAISKAQKPDEPIMNRDDWNMSVAAETKTAYLNALQKDPSLMGTAKELAKAGATKISLGEREDIEAMKDRVAAQSKVTAPGYVGDVETDLQRDRVRWMSPSSAKAIAEKYKISRVKATEIAQQEMVLIRMDKEIKDAYGDEKVVYRDDGWYVDDRLLRRNPYYAK